MPTQFRDVEVSLLDHLGIIDPETREGTVDFDPTLNKWGQIHDILDDMEFVTKVMSVAYDGALYSLQRHTSKDPNAKDLPIGAAIGSFKRGLFVPAFAQDKEKNDPDAHAEVMALRNLEECLEAYTQGRQNGEIEEQLGALTLAVTLEPCPSCLNQIQQSGLPISRVVYGSSRLKLEEKSILRPHEDKAPEIIVNGRSKGDYTFEFFQFPNAAVQAACVEIFGAFVRDLIDEKVHFDPEFAHVTRYADFLRDVDESRSPITINTDVDGDVPSIQLPNKLVNIESDALLKHFLHVMEGFQGRPTSSVRY